MNHPALVPSLLHIASPQAIFASPHDSLFASLHGETPSPLPKRSIRAKALPAWLQDYICSRPSNSKSMAQTVNTSHSSTTGDISNPRPYPLFLPSDLEHLSSSYVAHLLMFCKSLSLVVMHKRNYALSE